MKGDLRNLLFALCGLALVLPAAGATLTIRAEPDTLLAGLAPALRIWVSNDGATPAEVPTKLALQVIPPQGEPFVAYTLFRGESFVMNLDVKRPFILAPGETREITFWDREGWFGQDPRIDALGKYRLQMVADDGLDSVKLGARVLDQSGLIDPLVSNEIIFTYLEPTGDDLAVWNVARKQTDFCRAEVTDLIWSQYPNSRYAAYCVPHQNDPDAMKRAQGHEAVLTKNPPLALADGYRLNLAADWTNVGARFEAKDVEKSLQAYNRARSIYEDLVKGSTVPHYQRQAEKELRLLPSREDIELSYKLAHGEEVRDVRVGVCCYQKLPDGKLKVWFGYETTGSDSIQLPIGPENKFTPPPFDRKQPTEFARGRFLFVFSVITQEPVLTWHVQNKIVQFKAAKSVECPSWLDPKDPSTWNSEKP